jgi:hypothetical protein
LPAGDDCDPPDEACGNGRDDDCDGLTDCDDVDDCSYAVECCEPTGPEVCTNGLDDDCDARYDCDDDDCWDHPWCCVPTGAEICNDHLDNECDGTTDCSDRDCRRSPICFDCTPENCADGLDNDCDDSTDCDDGDCLMAPACCVPSPEQCWDGVDNDCDALTDCNDTWDCAEDPSCCWMNPEICDDGIDNNCDGVSDCEDWACMYDPICGNDTCDRAINVDMGGTFYGNTSMLTDDYQGTCASSDSPDAVYYGTVPFPMRVRIDTNGSGYDTVLYVRQDDCYGPEIGCDDDAGDGTNSLLELFLEAGTYYIFVDGWGSYSSGDYVLNVTPYWF